MVTPDEVAKNVLCSADARAFIDKIEEASDMGYDRVVINQAGQNQQEFITFMRDNVLPEFGLSAPGREVPGAEERLPPEPVVQSIPGGPHFSGG